MFQFGGRYCNILINFSIPMKLVRLTNICLNKTYSTFLVGLTYSGKPESLEIKLNGKIQLLIYADDVNILGGNVHNIKKNIDVSLLLVRRLD